MQKKNLEDMSQDEYWELMWKANKKTTEKRNAEVNLYSKTIPLIGCIAAVVAALAGVATLILTIIYH